MRPLRRLSLTFAAIIGLAMMSSLATAAPHEDKGKPEKATTHKQDGRQDHDNSIADVLITAGISVIEARRLAEANNIIGYDALPPGIRKNLARGKPLPPGIAKKLVRGPLLANLPVHPGYEWRVAGSDLVLVAVATAIVADVLIDIFK